MQKPQAAENMFLDAENFNTAFSIIDSSIRSLGEGMHSPGLINPSAMQITTAGLVATVNAPSPFAILFGDGTLCYANGNVDNQETSTYSIDFSSLVPATGSVTAYLVAVSGSIQEVPYLVPGPPPGHPDYNPSFQPYTSYLEILDTLGLAATTSAPDDSATIELARTTLSAGQVGLPVNLDTSHWKYASSVLNPTGITPGSFSPVAGLTVGADGRLSVLTTWPTSNFSQNGHLSLPNGWILNFGVTSILNNNASETVTFDKPFTTNTFLMLTTPVVGAGTEGGQSSAGEILSKTQATVSNTGSQSAITFAVWWAVLGY